MGDHPWKYLERFDETGKDRGPWSGLHRTCQSCQRETIEELEDGWCRQCNGLDMDDPIKRQYGKRWLYETTAKHLRKMGYPERAIWYEEKLREQAD